MTTTEEWLDKLSGYIPPETKLNTKADLAEMPSEWVQDTSYAIHCVLAKLHRETNAWQHLGGKVNSGEALVIFLREVAQQMHDIANAIAKEAKKTREKTDNNPAT